jgi:hypothetical protein
MNHRLIAYLAFIAAIFVVGPRVSFAAERWTVQAPATRIITSDDPATWPAEYVPAKVGAACDCSKRYEAPAEIALGMPHVTPGATWCAVTGRRQIAAQCGVAK